MRFKTSSLGRFRMEYFIKNIWIFYDKYLDVRKVSFHRVPTIYEEWLILKWQQHEIFEVWFFSWINSTYALKYRGIAEILTK